MKSVTIALFILFSITLFSQNSKEDIFKALKDKYGNLESISADFSLSNNSVVKGKFLAKSGNKYIMQMDNRIITCNGSTLWNYSIRQNNVVISKFEEMSDEVSVEKILFDLINGYKILEAKKEVSSGKQSNFVVTLQKNSTSDNVLNKVKIWVNPKNYIINSIGIDRGGDFEIWNLSNLKINPKLDNNKFEFSIPKNAEQIDLR